MGICRTVLRGIPGKTSEPGCLPAQPFQASFRAVHALLFTPASTFLCGFVCFDSGSGCHSARNNLPLASGPGGSWWDSACLTRGSAFSPYRKDFEMSQLNSRIEDQQVIEAQLQKKIKELQVWWKMFSQPRSPEFSSDRMCGGSLHGLVLL